MKTQVTRRIVRYSCYAVILLVSTVIIRQNAWKIESWRYRIDAGRIRHVTANPPGWEYYLHVPRGYTDQRLWPLFIYVHGTGGSGGDALQIWRPRADREGFLYLAPTFPLKGYQRLTNSEDAVLWTMIAEVQAAYAVDPARVFVCGFSGELSLPTALRSSIRGGSAASRRCLPGHTIRRPAVDRYLLQSRWVRQIQSEWLWLSDSPTSCAGADTRSGMRPIPTSGTRCAVRRWT